MMEDYYSTLGIYSDSTKEEVKKAYYKLIRKYTPEKNPDEFEKIRQAYEVLMDDESRKNYDMENKYGDEIKEYLEEAEQALDKKNFKLAIKYYKKILIIYPTLDIVRNRLALALAYDDQILESLQQFNQLIEKNPTNALYLNNIANVYFKSKNFKLAEEYFIKAYKVEPTNIRYIYDIENLYVEIDEKEKAINFIQNCISKNKDDDELIILCYFRLLRLYIIKEEENNIKKVVMELKLLIKNEQNKSLITERFKDICFSLYDAKLYFEICLILKEVISILKDEILNDIYKDSCRLDEIFSSYIKIREDERIIAPLVGPIHYFLYGNEMEEEEFKKLTEENIDAINSYLTYEYSEHVVDSIDIIKEEYSKLYEIRKDIYDDIYIIAIDKANVYTKLKKLEKDNSICESLKRLISLWITDDLSEEERRTCFSTIMRDMEYEKYQFIYDSINNMKNRYKILYDINPDYLEELKEIVERNIEGNKKYNYNKEKNIENDTKKDNVKNKKNEQIINTNYDLVTDKKVIQMIVLIVIFIIIFIFTLDKLNNKNNINEEYSDYKYEDLDEEYSDESEYKKDNNYIIEDSDSRYLSEDELSGYRREGLKYIKNEIYARHGYVFEDNEYQEYFDKKSWYKRDYSFEGKWEDFNLYEKANIELINNKLINIVLINDENYIIEDSGSRYLSEAELEEYTPKKLAYIRNEIYARYGYVFGDNEYQEYFDKKSWYERDYSFEGKWEDLNTYEKANIKLIKSIESKK